MSAPGDTGAQVARLRAEVAGLRAENARLSRLLDLRGLDTSPPVEQLAVPAAVPGLVTMASSAADKLVLYADRFRARADVYAVRWENSRTGARGWVPAVAGGWRRGLDRSSATYLPLTMQVLAAHLRGEVFIGLYPLLADNSCRFLTADFDGPAAMLDALAYVKAARAAGAPAGLEISQSGRGAHVWIFFAGSVSARVARAVGAVLVHEAIGLRGSMELRSYDRLFPNQDVLPDGGFGNLIAAPLHGGRRRDGLTAFLDPGTLEPYEDQWEFLSTLDRLSPGDADRVAHRVTSTRVGSEVTELHRPTATRIHPPLPAVVQAELGAGVRLDATQLSPAALATFKHAASIINPKFYELQRLRKSTWDTPRFVRGYDLTIDDHIILPRGLRPVVDAIVTQAGSRLAVTDTRNPGREIDLTCSAELATAQAGAVDALLAHDDGVLVAPPGSGKTVIACAIIAERSVSTLILVDRKALAEQWRTRIHQFLGIKAGQVGGGRRKLRGVVDIAMLPSLARHADIDHLTAGYGQIIVDECHHLAAAAYDHTVKRISAQFWLGLTATPARRDGLDDLVTWQLGPVRHTVTADQPSVPMTELGEPHTGIRRLLHVHHTDFYPDDVDLSAPDALARLHHSIVVDDARNTQIADDVATALRTGRNCLVLTRRIAHLDILATLLAARGHPAMTLQGGMLVRDRRAIVDRLADTKPGDGVLVIGTTPFIGEGFDAPALDTLFLAAPVSFPGLLIQCAGRVTRNAPGKTSAEVHDYHDAKAPILAASLNRRMPGYKALGFAPPDRYRCMPGLCGPAYPPRGR